LYVQNLAPHVVFVVVVVVGDEYGWVEGMGERVRRNERVLQANFWRLLLTERVSSHSPNVVVLPNVDNLITFTLTSILTPTP